MPEGDTIHRTARALRELYAGRVVTRVASKRQDVAPEALLGRRFEDARARGKNLLMTFQGDRVLVSHMGMEGAWHGYATGARWKRPAFQAALELELGDLTAVCFSPSRLRLMRTADLALDPRIAHLGADVLADAIDVDGLARALAAVGGAEIGEALLDQRAIAGIGNVYKSEMLFLERIDPFAPAASLEPGQLRALIRRARDLMTANLTGSRRRTRFGLEGPGLWVYERSGQPCLACGTTIRMRRQGRAARSTYFCPRCQRVADGLADRNGPAA